MEALKAELGGSALIKLQTGDVFNAAHVAEAAQGTQVIFHAASVPYHEMEEKLLPMARAVLAGAEQAGAKLVAIDGIYPYGKRTSTQPIREDFPKNPHTRKGRTKLEFEHLLFDPRYNGIAKLIMRLPDYYGPSMNQASYLGQTFEDIAAGKPTIFIGSKKVPHEFVYLPDAAYGQNWHIPSAGPISGNRLVELARKSAGSSKPVLPLGRASLSLLGVFGPVPVTPYEQGVAQTVAAMQLRVSERNSK